MPSTANETTGKSGASTANDTTARATVPSARFVFMGEEPFEAKVGHGATAIAWAPLFGSGGECRSGPVSVSSEVLRR
jgi:hypothetical protein